MSAVQEPPGGAKSASKISGQRRYRKFVLLLVAIACSVAVFLTLDWLYSAHVLRVDAPAGATGICFARDPVRHHALQANCSCIRRWGKFSYPFATNSLGFRDAEVRQVPVNDARLRILLLGDSFTEGMSAWSDSYVGRIAARFPQYEFLNGAVESYSPSNYFNVTKKLIDQGLQFDEVVVFIDMSDAQDEAAFYRDANSSGAVNGPRQIVHNSGWYSDLRLAISQHLLLTNTIVDFLERITVRHGCYGLNVGHGPVFDLERSAWTYRAVSDTKPYEVGYGPLGLEAGIGKEQSKMTLLWEELKKHDIPLSVVVYPWPGQIVHDTVDSREVKIWQNWCVGKCKRFVSLFPAFFAIKNQCPSGQPGCWYLNEFIFGDEHYNSAGNAIVAGVVARSLEETPLLKREQRRAEGLNEPHTK